MNAVISWMIGAIVFSTSFYYVSDNVSIGTGDLFPQESRTLSVTATTLAHVLLSVGEGWVDSALCTEADNTTDTGFLSDGSTRLGLGSESCSTTTSGTGNLSFEKLENLNSGTPGADGTNEVVDYEEARESLDLVDDNLDFHLRTYPNLPTADEVLEPGGRKSPVWPLYVGHYETTAAAASDDADDGKKEKDKGNPKDDDVLSSVPSAKLLEEARFIAALVRDFRMAVADDAFDHDALSYNPHGDVLPDDADVLSDALADRLFDGDGAPASDVTTLVIGSGVDPQSLLAVSTLVRDWVDAGGILVVLGSPQLDPEWLAPTLAAGRATASGEMRSPDLGHPSLHSPNNLDYISYEVLQTPVSYAAEVRSHFIHVATSDWGDLLAVSNPGAFGKGRVAVTAWEPAALVVDQAARCPEDLTAADACEPLLLVHNLLSLTLDDLYVDYGPAVPLDVPSGEETRLAYTYHPDLRETISLSVELTLFERPAS